MNGMNVSSKNHGYTPAQLLSHSNQHDNGMNYNHVTSTIPSTVSGSGQPYSAGGVSAGNLRNYPTSAGHVNQSSAVTLPVSQVPTPSNTPPVQPDPKLHYVPSNATMVRGDQSRNVYYSSVPPQTASQSFSRPPLNGIRPNTAAATTFVYATGAPNPYGQPQSSYYYTQQLRPHSPFPLWLLNNDQRPVQNYSPQQHQQHQPTYAVSTSYPVHRPYVMSTIVPPTNTPVQHLNQPAVQCVTQSESSQQPEKKSTPVIIQDPNTGEIVPVDQLANAGDADSQERANPPNILSDSAQEFVTQVSKRALEPSTSAQNSTQPSPPTVSTNNNNNNSNNNNNNIDNNIITNEVRLPIRLNTVQQQALLGHSDEWNNRRDSVGSTTSEYNSADGGKTNTVIPHSSSNSNTCNVISININEGVISSSPENAPVQENKSSSHRVVVDSSMLPPRLRTGSAHSTSGNRDTFTAQQKNLMPDFAGHQNIQSSISDSNNSSTLLPSVVTASYTSFDSVPNGDYVPQTVTNEKECNRKNDIIKRTVVAHDSSQITTENSVQIAQRNAAATATASTSSSNITVAPVATIDTTAVTTVESNINNGRVSSIKTTHQHKQQQSLQSSIHHPVITPSSMSPILSTAAPVQKADTQKQQSSSSIAATTTLSNISAKTLPTQSSQHPLKNEAHENRIMIKPNDHLPNLPKAFSTKPQQSTEKNPNILSREDNKPNVNVSGSNKGKKQQYNTKDANDSQSDQHYITTPATKVIKSSAHGYQKNTATDSSGRAVNIQHTSPHLKQSNGETNTSDTSVSTAEGKTKKKGKRKEINKKGQEKEGTEMDAIFDKSQVEKVANVNVRTPASSNVRSASNTNQATKGISSQKTPYKSKNEETPSKHEKSTTVKNDNFKSSDGTSNKSDKPAINVKGVQDNKKADQKLSATVQNKSISESKTTIATSEPKQIVLSINQREKQKPETKVIASGRKKYTLDQLELLQEAAQCKIKINLPSNLYLISKEAPMPYPSRSLSQSNYGNVNLFAPDFTTGGGRYNNVPMRRSQQGAGKRDKPPPIHVTLSLNDDVQLHQSEQAWKPDRLTHVRASDEDRGTRELNKAFTGILNKLTPQKFDTLVGKIQTLSINTLPRLQGVIELIFQKAIDEPGFCKTYAQLCNAMQSTFGDFTDPDNPEKTLNFRIILINNCQRLFEKNKADELKAVEREAEINSCTDPEKKKELQLLFEGEERRIRRKSVGNCRFIGELFKLGMLTHKIMIRCIQQLLSQIDEEPLECLCKLLTTIGKLLEEKSGSAELDHYFKNMKDLSEKKNPKISSRIRFMLLDVIDLRNNRWVPRRDENLPKTIDQIDQEFEQTQYNERMNASLMQLPKRTQQQDDRYRDNRKGIRTGGSRSIDESGWQTVQGKQNFSKPVGFTVDATKFQHIAADSHTNDVLGSATTFTKWGIGSAGSKSRDTSRIGSNSMYGSDKFAPLSGTAKAQFNRPVPTSNSLERSSFNSNRESTEPERHIRNSGSGNYAHNTQASSRESSKIRPTTQTNPLPNLKESDLDLKIKATLEEYCNHKNIIETISFLRQWLHSSYKPKFVSSLFQYTMDKSEKFRSELGHLLGELVFKDVLTSSDIIDVLSDYIVMWSDMLVDYPNYWAYLAEITVPMIAQGIITFEDIRRAAERIYHTPECGHYIWNMLDKAQQLMGTELVRLKWNTCDLKLTHFIKPENELEFINKHGLQYLLTHNTKRNENDRESEFKAIITKFIAMNNSDEILDYIKDRINDETRRIFIQALPVILEIDYQQSGSCQKLYRVYRNNIRYLIDNHEESLEVLCLTSISHLMNKLEFPKGLLLMMFEYLWDDHIISTEGFEKWRDIPNDNKGVCMKQLATFYEYIRENAKSPN